MLLGLRQLGASLRERIDSFSPRERTFLLLGGVTSVFLLTYLLFLEPVLDRVKVLDRLIVQKQEEVVEIQKLRQGYLDLQRTVSAIEGRIARNKDGFSIFSYVEGVAVQSRVKENIVFIRPQPEQTSGIYWEVGVEVKVENLTLAQLARFLEAVQQAPQMIRVKRMHVKKQFSDPRLLSGTFVVASYEKKDET